MIATCFNAHCYVVVSSGTIFHVKFPSLGTGCHNDTVQSKSEHNIFYAYALKFFCDRKKYFAKKIVRSKSGRAVISFKLHFTPTSPRSLHNQKCESATEVQMEQMQCKEQSIVL